jgi:hypothetical protein
MEVFEYEWSAALTTQHWLAEHNRIGSSYWSQVLCIVQVTPE